MTSALPHQPLVIDDPVLVIDIGGTNIKFGYSLAGQPMAFRKLFSTDALRVGDPVQALARMVDAVIEESRVRPEALVAAVPGFIDTDDDHILYAANIMSLNGRRLGTELSRLIGSPVLLERDAVLALTGEVLAGAVRGEDHVLGIFFGTGIGAAFMDGGKPFRGAGWALEIGLMPFCGQRRAPEGIRTDCLEAYASGRALQGIAERYGVAIDGVFRAAEGNRPLAHELALLVRYQAFAVGVAVAMVSPATIVLGGGVLDMDGFPRETLRELIVNHSPIAETGRGIDLRWCEHGWLAVLHGAPAVVAEHRSRHTQAFGASRTGMTR